MTVTGLDQLKRRIAGLKDAPKREMRREIDKQADRLVALAKALAPVDEGDLKASIRKVDGRHELAVRVIAGGQRTTREVRKGSGVGYDYAPFVEFEEQAFFYPAYRALRKSIRSALSRSYRRAAKLELGR